MSKIERERKVNDMNILFIGPVVGMSFVIYIDNYNSIGDCYLSSFQIGYSKLLIQPTFKFFTITLKTPSTSYIFISLERLESI